MDIKESAHGAAQMARTAHIHLDERGAMRAVRVSHPGKLTPNDVAAINKVLVNDVIKRLTGCACLSGTIDVIWEKNFAETLRVDLERVGA